MSLLWPDSRRGQRLALLPGQVSLGGKGQVSATRPTAPGWAGVLVGLDDLLRSERHAAQAQIVLSHHFCRLSLLPPPPTWLRPGETVPWLRQALAPVLETPEDWCFAWDPTPPGQPVPVAALPARDLEDLMALLAARGMKARGVRPWLASAWAARRGTLAGKDGWYGLLEPGRLTLARLHSGRLAGLGVRQLGPEPARDLADQLQREALMAGGAEAGTVWLESAGVSGDWSSLPPGYQVRTLSNLPDAAQGLLA